MNKLTAASFPPPTGLNPEKAGDGVGRVVKKWLEEAEVLKGDEGLVLRDKWLQWHGVWSAGLGGASGVAELVYWWIVGSVHTTHPTTLYVLTNLKGIPGGGICGYSAPIIAHTTPPQAPHVVLTNVTHHYPYSQALSVIPPFTYFKRVGVESLTAEGMYAPSKKLMKAYLTKVGKGMGVLSVMGEEVRRRSVLETSEESRWGRICVEGKVGRKIGRLIGWERKERLWLTGLETLYWEELSKRDWMESNEISNRRAIYSLAASITASIKDEIAHRFKRHARRDRKLTSLRATQAQLIAEAEQEAASLQSLREKWRDELDAPPPLHPTTPERSKDEVEWTAFMESLKGRSNAATAERLRRAGERICAGMVEGRTAKIVV